MTEENNKIVKYKQDKNSFKIPFVIYADIE